MDIAPLTREEIKYLLDENGYPTENPVLFEQIVKLIRILETQGYGISFSDVENENSILRRR